MIILYQLLVGWTHPEAWSEDCAFRCSGVPPRKCKHQRIEFMTTIRRILIDLPTISISTYKHDQHVFEPFAGFIDEKAANMLHSRKIWASSHISTSSLGYTSPCPFFMAKTPHHQTTIQLRMVARSAVHAHAFPNETSLIVPSKTTMDPQTLLAKVMRSTRICRWLPGGGSSRSSGMDSNTYSSGAAGAAARRTTRPCAAARVLQLSLGLSTGGAWPQAFEPAPKPIAPAAARRRGGGSTCTGTLSPSFGQSAATGFPGWFRWPRELRWVTNNIH